MAQHNLLRNVVRKKALPVVGWPWWFQYPLVSPDSQQFWFFHQGMRVICTCTVSSLISAAICPVGFLSKSEIGYLFARCTCIRRRRRTDLKQRGCARLEQERLGPRYIRNLILLCSRRRKCWRYVRILPQHKPIYRQLLQLLWRSVPCWSDSRPYFHMAQLFIVSGLISSPSISYSQSVFADFRSLYL